MKANHGMTQERLNELYAKTVQQMLNGYVAKNSDYMDAFNIGWDMFGFVAYKERIFEKIIRVIGIDANGANVSDESVIDTIYDIASYSVMALMRLQNPKLFKDGAEYAEKDTEQTDLSKFSVQELQKLACRLAKEQQQLRAKERQASNGESY